MNTLESPSAETKASDYYFDLGRNHYWMTSLQGGWISVNELQFKRALKKEGISPIPPKGQYLSPLENILLEIQQTRGIHYAGSLAGHRAGMHEAEEKRVLVTNSPRFITPRPGHFPNLEAVFQGLFRDDRHDQLAYFYGWLRTAYLAVSTGRHRPGQALVIAGERNCGKSLVQNLITLILGGRSARPYQYMTGATSFNSDLFEAEHLVIEDEQASTDVRARRNFGAHVKSLTVNRWQRCHAKNRVPVTLAPHWRLSITVNNEPENLMVLPPLDDSLQDKFIILQASKFPLPMPTVAPEQREAFWKRLVRELPAFLDFLVYWQLPQELVCERFGVRFFHHPEILRSLEALTPESRLLRFIEDEIFPAPDCGPWHGTAEQLERRLCAEGSECRLNARKLFTFTTACGVYLGRLHRRDPARFQVTHERTGNMWRILPPAGQ